MRELMRDRVGWAIGMLAVAAVICSGPGWASSRVALVVGNGAYTAGNISALANPVNDAKLMADALETSGFEVQLVTDADQAAMRASIEAFGERLEQAGGESVGLFYYAGHGVEVKGHNYLIPIGAEIEREVEFMTDAVPADWVMSWMGEVGNRLNIVILDACRNNPYEGRHRGASQGLAQMNAPTGTLIAYSAAPKQVAEDGEGDNSPYTASLAKTLVEPGLKIEDVFKRVRKSVEEVTNGRQTPWESSSLRGDFYFMAQAEEPPAPEPSTVTVTETVSPELTVQQLAARAYEAAERIHTVSSYRLVIDQFPGTLYAGLAEQQVEKLEKATAAQTPTPEETEASLNLDRAKRKRIQIGLREMGFDPGSPDGHLGWNSRKAITAWQRKNRYAVTGYLTGDQASTILTTTPPTALLETKCAELPGQYLGGDNHAECWEEVENQAGCFVWRTHYHSDQATKWTGQCPGGIAHGHGTYTVSAGSEHSAYKGTGTLYEGKASGLWIDEWVDGDRYEGEYRDGKRHGNGTNTYESGSRYEGKWKDAKPHGWGVYTTSDGRIGKGIWVKGCFWKGDGWWVGLGTTKEACGFDVKTSLLKVALTRSSYGNETSDWNVSPKTDLHTGGMHTKTPAKHALAKTITTKALRELIIETLPPVVLVDVLGDEDNPTLPGALVLKGAGAAGAKARNIDRRLESVLSRSTVGDKARTLVFFCHGAMCWLSYNAALRAVALGYEDVHWYRGGITAWETAGLPTAKAVKFHW